MLNNPLFAGNPQLQEQMRQQLPTFLQQVSKKRCCCLCNDLLERFDDERVLLLADGAVQRPVVLHTCRH